MLLRSLCLQQSYTHTAAIKASVHALIQLITFRHTFNFLQDIMPITTPHWNDGYHVYAR